MNSCLQRQLIWLLSVADFVDIVQGISDSDSDSIKEKKRHLEAASI
jgi:hypothetical protein